MNKNQQAIANLYRKQRKTGKPVDSSFGSTENLNKSRKDYRRVASKSQAGGQG